MPPIILPFIAAFSDAVDIVSEKYAVGKKHISIKVFEPMHFLFLVIYSIIAWGVFDNFNLPQGLSNFDILLFLSATIIAIIWNTFLVKGLKYSKLGQGENIINLGPILIVMISWIFVPSEFEILKGLAILISMAALGYAFWEKHHLNLNKGSKYLLIAVSLLALEININSYLLHKGLFSPYSLYALRVMIVFFGLNILDHPKWGEIKKSSTKYMAIYSIISIIVPLTEYIALEELGAQTTGAIMLLSPILVYLYARFVEKEKFKRKQVIAISIIICSVMFITLT